MSNATTRMLKHCGVTISVTDLGGDGPTVLLLHGLAGSSRELLPTGHARAAFVDDVVAVMDAFAPGERCTLVRQSMGAHTAFLTSAMHPDRVKSLVMLEGHVAGSNDPDEAAALGRWFASWPTPFADEAMARAFLGEDAIVDAWLGDLEATEQGLMPRFDADIMQRTLEAVHEPRWSAWETFQVATLAVFAARGMFSERDKNELVRRRSSTARIDLSGGSHDAHLDAFDEWVDVLTCRLG